MPYTTLVVLSDGTTYSGVSGCYLMVVDDNSLQRIENGEHIKNVPVILEIGLQEYHPKP
jgi:hypothetical protein